MLPPSDNWGPVSRGWCMSYPVVHSPLHPMCTALLPLSQLHCDGNLRRCTWSSAGQTNNRSADHEAFLTTSGKYHCANANMKLTNIYNTAKLWDFVNATCQEKNQKKPHTHWINANKIVSLIQDCISHSYCFAAFHPAISPKQHFVGTLRQQANRFLSKSLCLEILNTYNESSQFVHCFSNFVFCAGKN